MLLPPIYFVQARKKTCRLIKQKSHPQPHFPSNHHITASILPVHILRWGSCILGFSSFLFPRSSLGKTHQYRRGGGNRISLVRCGTYSRSTGFPSAKLTHGITSAFSSHMNKVPTSTFHLRFRKSVPSPEGESLGRGEESMNVSQLNHHGEA
jgi:hypothetical protein